MNNPVPWLRKGTGSAPDQGGCIMQVIDWISSGEWSDDPPCVHPIVRGLAIAANDSLPDGERQKLLELAPRMMGTERLNDPLLDAQLVAFTLRQITPEDDSGGVEHIIAMIVAAVSDEAAELRAQEAERWYTRWLYCRLQSPWHPLRVALIQILYCVTHENGDLRDAYEYFGAIDQVANDPLAFLTSVLDECDRLRPPVENEPLDYSGVCAVMSASP